MSNIIDSIQLSGTVYTLSAQTSGGGNPTIELTQAQYDALVTAGTVQADTYYIITDAQAGDLTNYYTKTETNTLLGGKADTATTYTKTEVDNAITAATATKQDTLVSGTNIKTINNESILGSGNIDIQGGGGKAIEAGTNISVTTGETADTINCTLPYKRVSNTWAIYDSGNNTATNKVYDTFIAGRGNEINDSGTRGSSYNIVMGYQNKLFSNNQNYSEGDNVIIGKWNVISGTTSLTNSFALGYYNYAFRNYQFICGYANNGYNMYENAFGKNNNSVSGSSTFGDSGNTLFSVGNGTAENARHNAFEIRQNGDIYITKDGSDIKLQDQLGGGGSSYTAGTGIDITNDVISVTGVVETSAITTAITSSSTDAQVPSAKAVYDIVGDIETLLSQI